MSHGCVHIWMQNCVLSYACGKVTGHDGLFSSITLHFKILKQGLSLNFNLATSARLACWANPHDPPCICPTVRDYGHTTPQPYFVLFIVQRKGELGGGSWDRIFCHLGYPWTPIFFPPTPMGLEHRNVSPGFVSNTTTDKYLKLQCVRAGGC